MTMEPSDLLDWWFAGPMDEPDAVMAQAQVWFGKAPETDRVLRERFCDAAVRAAAGELDAWRASPVPCLALILLLDQLPRNIWRGEPRAWSSDEHALTVARSAVSRGLDRSLRFVERVFVYLPFEHAEDRLAQREAVRLFGALADESPRALRPLLLAAHYGAVTHARIVERFGRFPHRNVTLGRESTPEEEAFLLEPGSSF